MVSFGLNGCQDWHELDRIKYGCVKVFSTVSQGEKNVNLDGDLNL